jgi:hypothetical protein
MTVSEYVPGMRSYDTLKDVLDYAIEEATVMGTQKGLLQGQEQERITIIQNMIANGFDWDLITKVTRVDKSEYLRLINKY